MDTLSLENILNAEVSLINFQNYFKFLVYVALGIWHFVQLLLGQEGPKEQVK